MLMRGNDVLTGASFLKWLPMSVAFTKKHAYLLFKVVDSGKKIIGFDLNEVAPGPSGDWDANVGARALWELINAAELSRR